MKDHQLSEKSKKQYYNLVSASIIALDNESQTPTQVSINCTLASEDKNITAKQVGKAQQMAQIMFFKHVSVDDVTVIDVHINSISPLGHMTQEEFLADMPEQPTEQQASEAEIEVLDTSDPFLSSVTTSDKATH